VLLQCVRVVFLMYFVFRLHPLDASLVCRDEGGLRLMDYGCGQNLYSRLYPTFTTVSRSYKHPPLPNLYTCMIGNLGADVGESQSSSFANAGNYNSSEDCESMHHVHGTDVEPNDSSAVAEDTPLTWRV